MLCKISFLSLFRFDVLVDEDENERPSEEDVPMPVGKIHSWLTQTQYADCSKQNLHNQRNHACANPRVIVEWIQSANAFETINEAH